MTLGSSMRPSSLVLGAGGRATRLEPVVFNGHAGALHWPVGQIPHGVAVVLCAPLGREARCAYRPLYLFAEAIAAQGVPVLRYDHLGDGDSLPIGAELDQWPLWVAGVEQAAAFVRAHTGTDSLVLGGLRIGASLAAVAAHSVKPDGLMLLAPLASGRAWIRELRIAAAMAGLPPSADGAIELDGLRLSPATLASLQGVDLKGLPPAAADTFLALPTPDPRLSASLGPRVRSVRFDGYVELFRDPQLNTPPGAVFEAAAAWLEGQATAMPDAEPAPPPAPACLVADDWTETPVTFGKDLRGVLCLPLRGAAREGVIFGNTGGDPRSGVGGFATRACRALASRGVAALRFDFAGLGESASPDAWRTHVYETPRTADFRAAADLLAQEGYDDPVLAGVGSGGYQALRAAIDDPRFRRLMAINARLVWRPGDRLEARRADVRAVRQVNLQALTGRSGWRRLLAGEVDVAAGLAALFSQLRRRARLRPPDAACRRARAEIARIAAGRVQVRILVGAADDSLRRLEADFGPQGRWLARRPGAEVAVIDHLDHGLLSAESQALALSELFRLLGLAPEARDFAARAATEASRLAASANRQTAI
jgi:alpha-beta hydrolase superfamily lysophospholipase